MPFCAVFYLFYHLEKLSWNASFLTLSDAGIVAAIFLVGVIGRWIMKFCIYRFQSVASYEAIADARLAVGIISSRHQWLFQFRNHWKYCDHSDR